MYVVLQNLHWRYFGRDSFGEKASGAFLYIHIDIHVDIYS